MEGSLLDGFDVLGSTFYVSKRAISAPILNVELRTSNVARYDRRLVGITGGWKSMEMRTMAPSVRFTVMVPSA